MNYNDELLIEAMVDECGAAAVKAAVDQAVIDIAERDRLFPDWRETGEFVGQDEMIAARAASEIAERVTIDEDEDRVIWPATPEGEAVVARNVERRRQFAAFHFRKHASQ